MQEITRLFDILDMQKEKLPLANALCSKTNGTWKEYSSFEFWTNASRVSFALWSMGFKKDDKVALISNNRPEWNMLDMGMLQIGVVNVPIYTTLSAQETQFILSDSGAKMIFVSDQALYQKIQSIRSQLPDVQEVITFDNVEGAMNWSDFLIKGELNQQGNKLEEVKKTILPTDVATLIYTSGTTGNPKGVMLMHDNLISNVWGTRTLIPAGYKAKALSFLPLCHVYERMLTYLYMYVGISIYYAQSMETIVDNLKEIKPDVFSTVPRLLEKVYDRIVSKGKELTGIKHKLFFWALDLGLKYKMHGENGFLYEMQLKLANKLIFNKWREALGGNVKAIVSGGAALQPRLARVFWAARITVLEGYGLTETSPVIAVNNTNIPDSVMIGTVGPVIEGVKVKIAEDGEILCKGPNVMKGYYKRPDLTSEVIDSEGYFHTGDIGVMVNDRYLKITDRKKEIFKTSGGKYIAPQALENKFKESQFIEQMMVVGENKKYAAALIVPAFAHLKSWCEAKGIAYTSNEEMINNQEVISKIKSEIDHYNLGFGQTEQVKKITLLPAEWTPQTGDLTQKLSLKRKVIMDRFKDAIDKMYGSSEM